jgi:Glycosyltransferase family 87
MASLVPVAVDSLAPARLRWLAVSFVAVAVAFSFWGTIGKPDCMDLDFGSYYRAANAVAQGKSPYFVDDHGPLGTYPYAPVFPFLLIPLGQLDYLWACRVWLMVNWLTLGACCMLVLRLVADTAALRAARWRILGLALIPMAAYMWYTLRVGQVSLLMLLCCLAWAVFRRSGWRFVGGVSLAVACALKLAPGVFLLYLLMRRDGRGLAGVVAGTVALFVSPALWVGFHGTVDLHQEWIHHTASTQIPEQTFRPGNQSLLGQLARLPPISNGHQCFSEDNLNRLCTLYPALILAAAAVSFGVMRIADGRREIIELALLFTFLTLMQPRGWRCNFVAMLLPCLLLAKECILQGPHWRVAGLALTGMTLACALPTSGVSEVGWSWPAWLLIGKHFWGAAVVGAATWWCCRNRQDYAACHAVH